MGRRWILYLFGVAMGTAMAYAYFGNRLVDVLASVFPSSAVKQELCRKAMSPGVQLNCLCSYLSVEPSGLKDIIRDASVDFGNSKTNTNPRYYLLHMTVEPTPISAEFKVWDDSVSVHRFYPDNDPDYECR